MESSTCFGEDLLAEMLKRLPAESLCRFLCVCKRWRSLISSDFFIKLHHSFACSATPPNLKPYLLVKKSPKSWQDSYALCRHRPLETDLVVEPLKPHDLHFPFRTEHAAGLPDGRLFNIVDVIHGVVCVSYSSVSASVSTVLWNPAIHKYVALPRLPIPFSGHHIGFGYDASNNDFKVVRVWVTFKSSSVSATYGVYSSQRRHWRTATCDINVTSNFSSFTRRTGCFVNGTIHWLLRNYAAHVIQEYTVLMFDCEREEFTATNLPRDQCLNVGDMNGRSLHSHEAELMEYEGMLSVVVSSCLVGVDYVVEHRVEVWVMEEHGVMASLKRRHQFAYAFDVRNSIADLDNHPLFHKLTRRDAFHEIRVHGNHKKYEELLNRRVYEESMFLMDDAEAQSYSKQGMVDICSLGMALMGYCRPVEFELIVPFE